MPQICTRCSRANPSEAAYCYYDGLALGGGGRAGGGPVSVGSQQFGSPFVFPSGRACRSFDELALACQEDWKGACALLKEGYLESFLGGLGRIDLARAAKEAARYPDPERGLDQLLEKIPSTVLNEPKLRVEPGEMNLGVLDSDKERSFTLTLENAGGRLLFGTASSTEPAWISLGEIGTTEKHFQFTDSSKIAVHIRPANVRASNKPVEAKILVETNGGTIPIVLRAEKAIKPFPSGALKGAKQPRQIAELAMKAPKEVAPFFEEGAVERWYQVNGWIYPVKVPAASGMAAVQQFFEALGLTKPPKMEISEAELWVSGDPGDKIPLSIDVSTHEKKAAWAHATSNVSWLEVSKAKFNGRTATINMTIASVPNKPGQRLEGELTVIGNGNVRWLVPVRLQVSGEVEAEVLEEVEEVAEVVEEAAPADAFDFTASMPPRPKSSPDMPPPRKSSPDIRLEEERKPAPRREEPKRRPSKSAPGTPLLMHLIPAVLLVLAVLCVAGYDFIPNKEKGGDGGPPGSDRSLLGVEFGPRATWGVTLRDPDDPKGEKGKQLTYKPDGETNSTVIKTEDGEFRFGFQTDANKFGYMKDGRFVKTGITKPVALTAPRVGWVSTFELNRQQVVVTQQVEVVKGRTTEAMDTLLVLYTVTNTSKDAQQKIGLRAMIDTYIGKNDGVPFTIPGERGFVSTQRSLPAGKVPDYIEAVERPKDPDNPGTIARLGLAGLGSKVKLLPPDRVLICKFPGHNHMWDDWKPEDMKDPTEKVGDSCVVVYWDPHDDDKYKPGESRKMGFTYGLTKLEVGGGLALSVPGSIVPNREFVITCYAYGAQQGQKLTLELPHGLEFANGESETKTIDEASDRSQVFWRVRATKEGKYPVTVTSGGKKSRPTTVTVRALGLFG